jgi:hypothetical protein
MPFGPVRQVGVSSTEQFAQIEGDDAKVFFVACTSFGCSVNVLSATA